MWVMLYKSTSQDIRCHLERLLKMELIFVGIYCRRMFENLENGRIDLDWEET